MVLNQNLKKKKALNLKEAQERKEQALARLEEKQKKSS